MSATPFFETHNVRMVVAIGNTKCIPIRYSTSINAHGATNTASITVPISSNPDFSLLLSKGVSKSAPSFTSLTSLSTKSLGSLAGTSDVGPGAIVPVSIYAGFPDNPKPGSTDTNGLSRRFVGIVDMYTAELHGDTVTFSCRSAAAPLVDTKITHISQNQTTTSFLAEQASRIGLQVQINTGSRNLATIQQVLGFDQIGGANFAASVYGMRIWDLLLKCAQFDDVDLWEEDGVLHYESPSLVKRTGIGLKWLQDWESLTPSHSLVFNRGIQVDVHSNSPRTTTTTSSRVTVGADGSVTIGNPKTVSTTSQSVLGSNTSVRSSVSTNAQGATTISNSQGTASGGNFNGVASAGAQESNVQKYTFYVRNQPPERVNLLAQAYARQISMHEYSISGKVPMTKRLLGELSIEAELILTNSPYARFNDKYWPRRYAESNSPSDGWSVDFEAVNHSLGSSAV